ncbi:hypothetical protein ACHAPC_002353 [Botrytis cinerea]|uniref:Putative f-box and wd domain-containing protein n=1 Tax=Botryotinia fuckeliana (strain BcDW1) TaxID=1290391 RepID=M7UJ79_BOTF1|nr:putative f-box and wd domain-containing protein [Botrytis cinerea BcDW1]
MLWSLCPSITSTSIQVDQSSISHPSSVLLELSAEPSSVHSELDETASPLPTLNSSTTSWASVGTTKYESSASLLAVTSTPQWPDSISSVASDIAPVSNHTSQRQSSIINVTSTFASTINSTSQSPSFVTSTTFGPNTNFGYLIVPTNSRQSVNIANATTFSFHHQTTSSFGHSKTGTVNNTTINTPASPPETDPETNSCIVLDSPDDDYYEFILVPNTKTITLSSNATYIPVPEFTLPVYCPPGTLPTYTIPSFPFGNGTDPNLIDTNKTSPGESLSPLASASFSQIRTTTVVVTSKNPQIFLATYTPPHFPGVPVTKVGKPSTLNPTVKTASPESNSAEDSEGESNNNFASPTISTTTMVVLGVPIVLSPSNVVINGHTIQRGNSPLTIKQKGHVFTVNPSQLIGPGTTFALPSSHGAIESNKPAATSIQSQSNPTPASREVIIGTSPTLATNSRGVNIEILATSTVVDNISVKLGPSIAVVNGQSYSIGSEAPQVVTVINTQTITIGIAGVGFAHTTLAPLLVEPTNHLIIGGEPISVGSSLAYIGSSIFTYGSGLPIQTEVFNGQTILIYPTGVVFAQTTLGGNSRTGNQIGIVGGLSVTEVGSSIAIISNITFTIGPDATPTKTVISGESISADQNGLVLAGTILTNPLILATHPVTMSDITFTQIGSSLAVIDGTTFTFGPGASPTSHTFTQHTIKVGSNGIEFAKTTFTGVSEFSLTQATSKSTSEGSTFMTTGEDSTHMSTSAAATSTNQKSDAGRSKAPLGIYGCIALYLIIMMT